MATTRDDVQDATGQRTFISGRGHMRAWPMQGNRNDYDPATGVPYNGTRGYATSCLWQNFLGGDGTLAYFNLGDELTSNWVSGGMGAMQLESLSTTFSPSLTVNSTDASYGSMAPMLTAPVPSAATGVYLLGVPDALVPNGLVLIPYGTDTADETFLLRVIGWREVLPSTWMAMTLGDFTCTLSTFAGVSGGTPDNTQLICDTISLTPGSATLSSCEVCSTADDTPAHVVLNVKGVQYIQFLFGMDSSAVSANCLWASI